VANEIVPSAKGERHSFVGMMVRRELQMSRADAMPLRCLPDLRPPARLTDPKPLRDCFRPRSQISRLVVRRRVLQSIPRSVRRHESQSAPRG
jgi:hypothetical protein